MAARLFAEQGFRQTDVQVIADALGIAKGTVYRYFPSKQCLFLATVDQGMRHLAEQVHAAADQAADPLGEIEAGVRAYLGYFDANPQVIELLMVERAEFKDRPQPTYFAHREANIGRWRNVVTRLMADGRVRHVPVERVLDVISDLLYGTIFTNYFAGRRKSFEKQAQDVLDVIFHGILKPCEAEQEKGKS